MYNELEYNVECKKTLKKRGDPRKFGNLPNFRGLPSFSVYNELECNVECKKTLKKRGDPRKFGKRFKETQVFSSHFPCEKKITSKIYYLMKFVNLRTNFCHSRPKRNAIFIYLFYVVTYSS